MAKTTKLAVLFGAIVIALFTAYFIWFQSENDASLVDSNSLDLGAEHALLVHSALDEAAGMDLAESEVPRTQSLALDQVEDPARHQRPERPQTRNDAKNTFSPVLAQAISIAQLQADIETWKNDMFDRGLANNQMNGKPVYRFELETTKSNPNSINKYFNKTLEELVPLAQQGDAAALLALANRAWSAKRWEEGDVYARDAMRASGSTEPLLHAAYQRQVQSFRGFYDPEAASWFLAAYLEGEISTAFALENYFRFMSIENQQWALDRAYEIVDSFNEGT